MTDRFTQTIQARLRAGVLDWDGSQRPDDACVDDFLTCRDIREAADEIDDLLDALEELVTFFRGYQGMKMNKARAVIRKWKG